MTEEVTKQLKEYLGEPCSHCEIGPAGPECGGLTCSSLPASVTKDIFYDDPATSGSENHANRVVVTFDNNTSPVHSMLQLTCKGRKGLLYDCLRTVKDFNLKVIVTLVWQLVSFLQAFKVALLLAMGWEFLDAENVVGVLLFAGSTWPDCYVGEWRFRDQSFRTESKGSEDH